MDLCCDETRSAERPFGCRCLPTLCLFLKERLGNGPGLESHEQFIFEHVAPACGNLCRALGEDFAMFVPVVLPHLLAALEAEVKFSMEAADPDDDGEEVSFAPGTTSTNLWGNAKQVGPFH